ncbi:hypothetical protein [uncultured Sphingomonas sp.]|uniref:hypothetical protein n=1 Tax=uncultured Sphingomonas sp. TaxID=158754 RepID=UPI0035CA8E29
MTGSHRASRFALCLLGVVLLLLSPLVTPVPGPGGIFFVAGGLILILRNSARARRSYTRRRRRWPRLAAFLDRAMRRPSDKRRRARLDGTAR